MNAKDCRTVRLEIDTSELGQRLSEPVETHVAGCAACAGFRTERAQLRELVGSLKPVAAPADFDMRLRARMARERESRQPLIFRFAMTTPAIAIAAILVVAVASIVWINQTKQTPNSRTVALSPGEGAPGKTAPPATSNNVGNQSNEGTVATIDQPETVKRVNQTPRAVKSLPPSMNTPWQGTDRSTTAAQTFRQTDRAGEVSLTAPSKPMVVSVRDANGATHKILLPPISFGSQQRLDNRTPVSMSNGRDW